MCSVFGDYFFGDWPTLYKYQIYIYDAVKIECINNTKIKLLYK